MCIQKFCTVHIINNTQFKNKNSVINYSPSCWFNPYEFLSYDENDFHSSEKTAEERNSYRFGTTRGWVNDDKILIVNVKEKVMWGSEEHEEPALVDPIPAVSTERGVILAAYFRNCDFPVPGSPTSSRWDSPKQEQSELFTRAIHFSSTPLNFVSL